MAGNLLRKDAFTVEYRFAKDLVKAVIEMKAESNFSNNKKDCTFLTDEMKTKIKEMLKTKKYQLDKIMKKLIKDGQSEDYSDDQFASCVRQLIDGYKPEHQSEEEFAFICARVSYVVACFSIKNKQSEAASIAAKHLKEICLDTFCPSGIIEAPIFDDAYDNKYIFVYDLVKTLVEMRGSTVRDVELPDVNTRPFTNTHRNEIKEFFSEQSYSLDNYVKCFVLKDGACDCSDEKFSLLIDRIVKDYGLGKVTESDILQVCARIAYSATWFLRENSKSNAEDMAVDRIHQMVKKYFNFDKYEKDDDYRFSRDLLEAVIDMGSNPFEMSHSDKSLFRVAHQNKIRDFLSREKPDIDEAVKKFGKDGSLEDLFRLCMNRTTDNCDTEYQSKEEMVHACAKIAYVAVCFFNKNGNSKTLVSAMNRMLEIVKGISHLPSSDEEKELIIHTQDDHYRFAYDLVRTVLEMKNIPVFDKDFPNSSKILFTETHRNQIKDILSSKSAKLDGLVERVTNSVKISDYSDNSFVLCMHQIIKKYRFDQKAEKGLLHIGAYIAYFSMCFIKKNCKSNAAFLAANRIYEMLKHLHFVNSTEEKLCIMKMHDDHYRFAYDLSKAVFSFKGIPISPIDVSDPGELFFTETRQNEVQSLLSSERAQLDEMVAKLTDKIGRLYYTDAKFLNCMDQIVQDYQHELEDGGFVRVCTRIAYTAAEFCIQNYNSHATFLAVNRLYEMSKYAFRDKMEDVYAEEENFQFTYDLLIAALKIGNNSSSKLEVLDRDDSLLTSARRNEVRDFLSKEWPLLNHLVKRFTKTSGGMEFNHSRFLQCVGQIISDYEAGQKSEDGLLLTGARIAYVATYFLRKNLDSTAYYSALDLVYQMVKNFYRTNPNEEKPVDEPVRDDKYRFAVDLVRTVMELQDASVEDAELPDADNLLFTKHHRNAIKQLFQEKSERTKIRNLVKSSAKGDYSDTNFQSCMESILKEYKCEQATKQGFVLLCARIAYPVFYFKGGNNESNAEELAVNCIHEMVKGIYYFNKDEDPLKDDKYRFAYDLVGAVVEMKSKNIPDEETPKICPDPKNFLFTAEHKRKIEESLSRKNNELRALIRKFSESKNSDCRDESFKKCMDQIIRKFKPKIYTEEGFVLLCGKLALAASYFMDTKGTQECDASNLALNKIYEMIQDVYKRGTLANSSW